MHYAILDKVRNVTCRCREARRLLLLDPKSSETLRRQPHTTRLPYECINIAGVSKTKKVCSTFLNFPICNFYLI